MTPPFPFQPKSTTHLARGQFWALPLDDGRFGAACVVGEHWKDGRRHTRSFIAGVMAWHGRQPPTAADLKGCAIAAHGFAHIKTIVASGGQILGQAQPDFGNLPTRDDSMGLPIWGFLVPGILARQWVDGQA